ncbi:MAG: 3'-5' exonuclease, partial [Eubacteriales bacterium]|nr:3'-5' exonuclease [Eubacteriales bacterium]
SAAETGALSDGPAAYVPDIERCIQLAQRIGSADSYEKIYKELQNAEFVRLPQIRKTSGCDPAKQKFVKDIRDSFKKYILETLKNGMMILPPEEFEMTVMKSAAVNKTVIELAIEFSGRFEAKKRENNIVDFGDLEHLALKLLYTEQADGNMVPSAIADDLAGQLKEVMIDEYQDSNAVQDALLKALSAERFGRPDIFMVGDVKQSIYRFRQSDPGIFIEKYDTYSDDGSCRKIELNNNFRSRIEVVNSVNTVFDRIMRRELGGVEYTEASRLDPKAAYKPNEIALPDGSRINACRTELLIADTAALEGADDSNDADAEELEYELIAKKINELIDPADKNKCFRVQDKETNELRPAGYGDIVILMRAVKDHAEKLVDILTENGIPAHFNNSTGYFTAVEIETVLAFLNIIDNPHQDIPLAAVMRSPMFDFSDEELSRIKISFGTEKTDYWDAVRYFASFDEKTARFVETVNRYRQLSDLISVHMLLNRIYSETGYYNYISAMPAGSTRRRNLDILLEKAESYSKTGLTGLFNFTRYIEALKTNEFDYGEAAESFEDDNIVTVMTIHGSKGLEFPIVFLARTSSKSAANDREEGILIDNELGTGSDYLDPETGIKYPGLKKKIIKLKNSRENIGERLRLLYVAMTRAKEKLIITGTKASTTKETTEEILNSLMVTGSLLAEGSISRGKLPVRSIIQAGNYLEWILLSAGENNNAFDLKIIGRKDLAETAKRKLQDELDVMKILKRSEFCGTAGNSLDAGPENAGSEKGSDETSYEAELAKIFNAEYNYQSETVLRPKKSVSEIKHKRIMELEAAGSGMDDAEAVKTMEAAAGDTEPDKTETEDAWMRMTEDQFVSGISRGALKGTAFHRAMELLDFREEPDDDLKYLEECSLMQPAEKELLDKNAVKEFIVSELGQRMKKAFHQGRLRREQRFMVGIPACELDPGQSSKELQLLQGIIDAYIEEEDGSITLIDYKTDKVKNDRELADKYEVQLELYKKAIEQLTLKPVGQVIIYSTFLKRQIML